MNRANVLVLGSGGREHALAWKLQQSPLVGKVFCALGNGGTLNNINIPLSDFGGLANFATQEDCFTVVGPEDPLADGIVDLFREKSLEIYGPTRAAAQAESSKVWAKDFMKKYSIPTASFKVFDDAQKATDYVDGQDRPFVVKADGLAAGKGVIVCNSASEARDAIRLIMIEKRFREAGRRVVLEEPLVGEEASYMAIVDTKSRSFIPLASSQDHKQIYDGDKGPNTGGMGAYSPTPVISSEIEEQIERHIITNFIDGMRAEGITFEGTLYLGLMIFNGRPCVLEFNVRFGDPELQPMIVRLDDDLFPYFQACVQGRLDEMDELSWMTKSAVTVVMTSAGYPGTYEKGRVILGLNETARMNDVLVFHAGTTRTAYTVLTNGGRVLGVTALGEDIKKAIARAYEAVNKVHWEGEYHRTDIGAKTLKYVAAS